MTKPKYRFAVPVTLLLLAGACTSSGGAETSPTSTAPAAVTTSTAPAVTTSVAPTTTTSDVETGSEATEDPSIGGLENVADYLDELEEVGLQGVVIIDGPDGSITRGFGLANRSTGETWDEDTVFDVGSLTKQFTAAAIVGLQMDGLLTVDDSLVEHLDVVPPELADLTIYQLLTHTAGLPLVVGADYEPIELPDYLTQAASEITEPPADGYRYSNVGYSLLGAVIESVSGESYEEFLQRRLFAPAGMASTGNVVPDWDEHVVAVGYNGADELGRPHELAWASDGPYWNLRANGGVMTTAADMFRWHEALLADDVLDAAAKDQLFAMQVAEYAGSPFHYGFGWEIAETPEHGTMIHHSGANGYFFASLHRFPDTGETILFATNNPSGLPADFGPEHIAEIAVGAEVGTRFGIADDTGDGEADCGSVPGRDAMLAAIDDMEVLGEFPDTASGQTSEAFVSLLLNGSDDDAATLQFLDDHVADGQLPDSAEQRLGQLGALNDLLVAATITHIVQVDSGSYAVITEAPDFVVGLVFADETSDEISCLTIE